MSLKAIAAQELARLKAGEMVHETEEETRLKQVKQTNPCFIDASSRFTLMKHAQPRKTAENGPCFIVSSPRGETHETSLPEGIVAGLATLKTMRSPKLRTPNVWPRVVADALKIARDGWAAKALALGWAPLDLFGAATDADGDPWSDGLAVWLAGHKLLAISATTATVEDGGGRAYFNRREQVGAQLLWAIL